MSLVRSLTFVAALVFPLAALAGKDNQVVVQGQCKIKVTPDRGTITFAAENQAKDQKLAVQKTTEQINSLKIQIQALKLKDLELKNTNYNVYPVREYEKERYVDKGTRATLTLEVTTSEIARIGEAIAIASKAGIQNVGPLQTFLSVEKSQAEYLKCLDIAADDARKKAKQLARKLDFKIGDVVRIQESPKTVSPPFMSDRSGMMMAKSGNESTSIEAGEQEFNTSIEVTFSIK